MPTLDYRIIRIPERWNWKKYTMLSKTANAVREQTSAAQGITPPRIIWNILFIFWHYLSILFVTFFRTQAAQYECSYRRTAHHATDLCNRKRNCEKIKNLWKTTMVFSGEDKKLKNLFAKGYRPVKVNWCPNYLGKNATKTSVKPVTDERRIWYFLSSCCRQTLSILSRHCDIIGNSLIQQHLHRVS